MKKIVALPLIIGLLSGCANNGVMNNDSEIIEDEVYPLDITTKESIHDSRVGILTGEGTYSLLADKVRDGVIPEDNASKYNVINFGFNSYKVEDSMKEIVEMQSELLTQNPDVRVILSGHTDERGDKNYNLVLGEKRAIAVEEMLLSSGVHKGQIEVISYGEEKPTVEGSNEEAWKANRRVVFEYK